MLLPAKGGKSYLQEGLKKYQRKKGTVRVIDLDAYAERNVAETKSLVGSDNWETKIFPKIKASLEEDLKNFKDDKFVVITSNVDICTYMGISEKRIEAYLPGTELSEEILKGIDDEAEKKRVRASREKYIQKFGAKLYRFAKLDDLVTNVARRFKMDLVI